MGTRYYAAVADKLLTDDEQRSLQNLLLEHPDSGALIERSGGLRKLRFGAGNKGKSGGVRTIYYHHCVRRIIFLLLVYSKGRQDNLTDQQRTQLRALVKKEFQ